MISASNRSVMTQKTEEEYIRRLQQGDANALRYVMTVYQHKVFSLMINLVKNEDDAQELTQDVFIKVFQRVKGFKFGSKFSTWLYRIAYNEGMSFLRKNKIKTESLDLRMEFNHEPIEMKSMDLLKEEERNLYIGNALEKLGPQQRMLVQLFYLEELTIKEIRDVAQIPESSIKTGLLRARQNLLKHMQLELKEELNSLL